METQRFCVFEQQYNENGRFLRVRGIDFSTLGLSGHHNLRSGHHNLLWATILAPTGHHFGVPGASPGHTGIQLGCLGQPRLRLPRAWRVKGCSPGPNTRPHQQDTSQPDLLIPDQQLLTTKQQICRLQAIPLSLMAPQGGRRISKVDSNN